MKKDFTEYFCCPITQEIFQRPVIATDGFTYEHHAIQSWFDFGNKNSPMTNQKVAHSSLIDNLGLKSIQKLFRDEINPYIKNLEDSLADSQLTVAIMKMQLAKKEEELMALIQMSSKNESPNLPPSSDSESDIFELIPNEEEFVEKKDDSKLKQISCRMSVSPAYDYDLPLRSEEDEDHMRTLRTPKFAGLGRRRKPF